MITVMIFPLIVTALFTVLHFTRKLRFSSQAVMLITTLGGLQLSLVFGTIAKLLTDTEKELNDIFTDDPVSIAPSKADYVLFIIFAAAVIAILAYQLIRPHDKYSFGKHIYSEKGEKLIGGRRLAVTGIVSTVVFVPAFFVWLITTIFTSLTRIWAIMFLISLIPFFHFLFFYKEALTAGAIMMVSDFISTHTSDLITAYGAGSIAAYIILTIGLVRITLLLTQEISFIHKRKMYLFLSAFPIINLFFGFFLIVKANKAIKAEKPTPVIHERNIQQ